MSNTNTKPRVIVGSEVERIALVPRSVGLFFLTPAGLFSWSGAVWISVAAGGGPAPLAFGVATIVPFSPGVIVPTGLAPGVGTKAHLTVQGLAPDATLTSLSADMSNAGFIGIIGNAPATASVNVFWTVYA